MAKIIKTLVVEDGMEFDEICSFETKTYFGIWNHQAGRFIVLAKTDVELYCYTLEPVEDLKGLDDMVYRYFDEHIKEVYTESTYEFCLIRDKEE